MYLIFATHHFSITRKCIFKILMLVLNQPSSFVSNCVKTIHIHLAYGTLFLMQGFIFGNSLKHFWFGSFLIFPWFYLTYMTQIALCFNLHYILYAFICLILPKISYISPKSIYSLYFHYTIILYQKVAIRIKSHRSQIAWLQTCLYLNLSLYKNVFHGVAVWLFFPSILVWRGTINISS